MQRPGRGAAYRFASHGLHRQLSYRTQVQPGDSTTQSGLGPPPSITKKMPCRLSTASSYRGVCLGLFLSDGVSLCQADIGTVQSSLPFTCLLGLSGLVVSYCGKACCGRTFRKVQMLSRSRKAGSHVWRRLLPSSQAVSLCTLSLENLSSKILIQKGDRWRSAHRLCHR